MVAVGMPPKPLRKRSLSSNWELGIRINWQSIVAPAAQPLTCATLLRRWNCGVASSRFWTWQCLDRLPWHERESNPRPGSAGGQDVAAIAWVRMSRLNGGWAAVEWDLGARQRSTAAPIVGWALGRRRGGAPRRRRPSMSTGKAAPWPTCGCLRQRRLAMPGTSRRGACSCAAPVPGGDGQIALDNWLATANAVDTPPG